MKRFARLLALLTVVAPMVLAGCGAPEGSADNTGGDADKWERFEVVASLSGKLQFRGVLEARQSFVIENPGSPQLLNVFHGDGDTIAAGEAILQWDDTSIQTQLAQKREELAINDQLLEAYIKVNIPRQRLQDIEKLHRIEKDILQAKSSLDLESHLLKQNKGDKKRLAEARNTLQRLRSMHQDLHQLVEDSGHLAFSGPAGNYQLRRLELKNAIRTLEEQLAKCTAVAPFAGVVQALQSLRTGPMASGPVVRVINTQSLLVIGKVWQNEFLRLQPGQKAKVYPDFLNRDPLPGQIESKIPYGEKIKEISTGEEMAQFKIRVKLLAGDKDLLAGMTAMVVVEPEQSGIQVPEAYIHEDKKGHYILKTGNRKKPKRVNVSPVPSYQGYAVVSGLKTGDVLLKPLSQKSGGD